MRWLKAVTERVSSPSSIMRRAHFGDGERLAGVEDNLGAAAAVVACETPTASEITGAPFTWAAVAAMAFEVLSLLRFVPSKLLLSRKWKASVQQLRNGRR